MNFVGNYMKHESELEKMCADKKTVTKRFQVKKFNALSSSLIVTFLGTREGIAENKHALNFIPKSDSIAFAFTNQNGEFWAKLVDGEWLRIPQKYVYYQGSKVVADYKWLASKNPSLITEQNTSDGDYVAFNVCHSSAAEDPSKLVSLLHPNLPGVRSCKIYFR